MMKQYPMTVTENYQNKNSLNKDFITAKVKSIQTGFKKAADADKKKWWLRCGFHVLQSFCEPLMKIAGGHKPAIWSGYG